MSEASGLSYGPLGPLLQDATVTEIMVNGPGRVFAERHGRLEETGLAFESADELRALMVSMAARVGRTLDQQHPCVDGRLPDGSRINCVMEPVALDGPALTIRKFPEARFTLEQMLERGTLDLRLAHFLVACVQARINLVVSGGTGVGKTTLLNALSAFIPRGQRIVTIEDTAELNLDIPNLVRMEAQAATPTDAGVPVRSLVINALRMRPDRILVGEVRGPEAFDMLTAMNTGHEGSMGTVHANSARDALERLESMVLMGGLDMPAQIVKRKIAGALQLVVHLRRCADGVRRVVEVVEVAGMHQQVFLTQDVVDWSERDGFVTRGLVPGFVRGFAARDVDLPDAFFSPTFIPPPFSQPTA